MNASRPKTLPTNLPPSMASWAKSVQQSLNSQAGFGIGGIGEVGGTFPAVLPESKTIIPARIRYEGSSSSSDGSSSSSTGGGSSSSSGSSSSDQFSYDPDGAGFTDSEGYLAYAFDETYSDSPWKGKVVDGGISTSMPATNIAGSNYAYPLNGDTWSEGDNVLLWRAGEHWVIIGAIGGSQSSTPMTFVVDCEAGTIVIGPGNPGVPPTSSPGKPSSSLGDPTSSSNTIVPKTGGGGTGIDENPSPPGGEG